MKLLFCVSASKWLRSHRFPIVSFHPALRFSTNGRSSFGKDEWVWRRTLQWTFDQYHALSQGRVRFFSLRKIAQSQHKKPISKSTEVAFSIIFLGRKFKGRLCLMVSDPLVGSQESWTTCGSHLVFETGGYPRNTSRAFLGFTDGGWIGGVWEDCEDAVDCIFDEWTNWDASTCEGANGQWGCCRGEQVGDRGGCPHGKKKTTVFFKMWFPFLEDSLLVLGRAPGDSEILEIASWSHGTTSC